MAPYEALFIRKYRSSMCWEVSERKSTGPELITYNIRGVPIICQRLKTAFVDRSAMQTLREKMHNFP